jgi:hypothetical protein
MLIDWILWLAVGCAAFVVVVIGLLAASKDIDNENDPHRR